MVILALLFCREDEKLDAGTETNSNLNHELYYHFLGTDQSQDILCWKDPDNPKHMFGADVTDDGKVPNCPHLECSDANDLSEQYVFINFFCSSSVHSFLSFEMRLKTMTRLHIIYSSTIVFHVIFTFNYDFNLEGCKQV